MTSFRTHLFTFALLAFFALVFTLPAIAQATKAVTKHHQNIAGKSCDTCHKKTYTEWKGGPHGANGVECTVCHSDVASTVTATPALSTCEGCHADKVAQLKSDPFMSTKGKTCVTCHPPHALKPHPKAA